MQTTLLKELKIQAGGGGKGSQQFIKWQQASQVGTAEWEAARENGARLSTDRRQSKASSP